MILSIPDTPAVARFASVSIPPASVKLLNSTPFEIVPPLGPNVIVLPGEKASVALDWKSIAYTNVAGNNLRFWYYPPGSNASEAINATGLVDATVPRIMPNLEMRTQLANWSTTLANTGIYLVNDGTGEYATGDSPLMVALDYYVWKLPLS